MATRRYPPVSFDQALAREQVRQQRHRDGGQVTNLSDRLALHEGYPTPQLHNAQKEEERVIQEECDRAVQSILELCQPEPPAPLPKPTLPPLCYCPFHGIFLEYKTSPKGWNYAKCPVKPCVFFCGLDRVEDWSQGLARDLHPSYKAQPFPDLTCSLPFTCHCTGEGYHELKLNKSATAKNPNRFFLACKNTPSCRYFQWLDFPPPKA